MAPQVKTVALVGGASFERGIDESELAEHLRDPSSVVWLDVCEPGPDERALLMQHFGAHPLALEDHLSGLRRPRLDEHPGHFALVLHAATEADERLRLVEVTVLVGPSFVVTVHREPLAVLDEASHRWQRGGTLLTQGVGYLLYVVLDTLMASYTQVTDRLGESMAELQAGLVDGPIDTCMHRMLAIRGDVFQLRRYLYPTREAFGVLLRTERPLVSSATRAYLQETNYHLLRVLDLLEVHREMAAGSIDASLTIISNRLNITMRRLTVISAAIGFTGCVFGAWGMNLPEVPWSGQAHGFALIVGASCVISLAAMFFGWRRGWL